MPIQKPFKNQPKNKKRQLEKIKNKLPFFCIAPHPYALDDSTFSTSLETWKWFPNHHILMPKGCDKMYVYDWIIRMHEHNGRMANTLVMHQIETFEI